MELFCESGCGLIGMWYPRDMVEKAVKEHVEGHQRKPYSQKPHPGHKVVTRKDSAINLFTTRRVK